MTALLLTLALLLPVAPLPVRVVLVGAFTPVEQAAALGQTQRALDFWATKAPEPIPATATYGATLAAPADYAAWLAGLGPHATPTVYIVNAPAYPAGEVRAHAAPALRYAVVPATHPLGAEALLAHEIGHLLYGLPDTYPCGETDMMCNPASAYPARLGCATLALLGAPCQRVGLPLLRGVL